MTKRIIRLLCQQTVSFKFITFSRVSYGSTAGLHNITSDLINSQLESPFDFKIKLRSNYCMAVSFLGIREWVRHNTTIINTEFATAFIFLAFDQRYYGERSGNFNISAYFFPPLWIIYVCSLLVTFALHRDLLKRMNIKRIWKLLRKEGSGVTHRDRQNLDVNYTYSLTFTLVLRIIVLYYCYLYPAVYLQCWKCNLWTA